MNIEVHEVLLILAKKKMTKTQLAKQCGIAPQNISTILRRGTCRPATAGKLAKGLGVAVTEIVKED